MTKTEFKDQLQHYTNLLHAVCALLETFRYYRVKDKFKAREISEMATRMLDIDQDNFHLFDDFLQKNWGKYYADEEFTDSIGIYAALKAKEVELLETFKDDNVLETEQFSDN